MTSRRALGKATKTSARQNKQNKQTNPQDAFALCRYNLDNLYLSVVVRTRALTDRCFDLWAHQAVGWGVGGKAMQYKKHTHSICCSAEESFSTYLVSARYSATLTLSPTRSSVASAVHISNENKY